MGEYDTTLSDWTLLFRWTGECCILFSSVADVAHTSAERQRSPGWRVAAALWGSRTLRSFLRDILNERFPGRWIGRASPTSPTPLPWPRRSHELTTPENSLWGIIMEEWLRITTKTTKICAEPWKTPSANYSKNALKYVTEDMQAHPFVPSIKLHIRFHWTCNQAVRKLFKSN